jgi:hypothetical protein
VGGHRGWAPGAIMVSLGGPVQSFVKFDILGSFLGLAAHRVRTKEFFFIEKGTLMSGANRGTSGSGASEGVKRLAKVDWLGAGSGGAPPAQPGARSVFHGTLHGKPGQAGQAGRQAQNRAIPRKAD